MAIRLAVFDLAGTTVKDNNDVPRILKSALEEDHVSVSLQDAVNLMGIPKPEAIRQLLTKANQQVTTPRVDAIHKNFVANMRRFYLDNPFVEEREGVSGTFQILKQKGIRVVVDTGFDRVITDVLLKRMGWVENELIDGSVCSDEVAFGRPFPDMIYRAMAICGVESANHVAKIGDTTSDLAEGLNAGCKFVIGITTGAHSRSQLAKHYHTHLVENVEQIIPILEQEIFIPAE